MDFYFHLPRVITNSHTLELASFTCHNKRTASFSRDLWGLYCEQGSVLGACDRMGT